MSNSSKSDDESSFDIEELVKIGTRCRELREEKDLLRESQSHSLELIRRLERHAKLLSEARTEDKKHIQKLETELLNCSQELDYLQDQLNGRNEEVYNLGEHVHELELQLADMENLRVIVSHLTEELTISHSKHLTLMQELSSKEEQLDSSSLLIEKLEETISALTLDSQCEIEIMRLDKMDLEQACIESKKVQEETFQERENMNRLIKELELKVNDADKAIAFLEKENMDLKEKLLLSETKDIYLQNLGEWKKVNNNISHPNGGLHSIELRRKHNMSLDNDCFAEIPIAVESQSSFKEQIKRMSHQISEYEVLVKQLKEELREEKFKAKEEAEDLTQEMAELRYQMTTLLEEECKRRASIEQASLQRIAELEAQLKKNRETSFLM